MDIKLGKKIILFTLVPAVVFAITSGVTMSKTVWEIPASCIIDKQDTVTIPPISLLNNQYELFLESDVSYVPQTTGNVSFEHLDKGLQIIKEFSIPTVYYGADHQYITIILTLIPGEYNITWITTTGSLSAMKLTVMGLIPEAVGYIIIATSVIALIGAIFFVRAQIQKTKIRKKYNSKN